MTQKLGTKFGTEKWNRKWHKKTAQNTKWYRTATVVEAPVKKRSVRTLQISFKSSY